MERSSLTYHHSKVCSLRSFSDLPRRVWSLCFLIFPSNGAILLLAILLLVILLLAILLLIILLLAILLLVILLLIILLLAILLLAISIFLTITPAIPLIAPAASRRFRLCLDFSKVLLDPRNGRLFAMRTVFDAMVFVTTIVAFGYWFVGTVFG